MDLSEMSVGFSDPDPSLLGRGPVVKRDDFLSSAPREILSDTYCIAAICKKHQQIALQRHSSSNFYFLPYKQIESDNVSFGETVEELRKTIFTSEIYEKPPKVISDKLVDIYRVEHPKINQYMTRYISVLIVNPSKDSKCCVENETIYWMDQRRLTTLLKAGQVIEMNLLGNEPLKFLKTKSYGQVVREVSIQDALEFSEGNSSEATLFKALNYNKHDLQIILNEFILQCYPSETLSFASFVHFAIKLWPELIDNLTQIGMLFNCINPKGSNALTFQEIITGFCFIDENAVDMLQNQSNPLTSWLYEKRCPYIFRYYDFDQDGCLNTDELSHFLNDYVKELNENAYQVPPSLTSEQGRYNWGESILQQFGQPSSTGLRLSIDRFRDALQQGLMDKLLTEQSEIVDMVKILPPTQISLNNAASRFACIPIPYRSKHLSFCKQDFRPCQACSSRKMALSDHFIRLSESGEVADIIRLEPLSSDSLLNFAEDIPETDIFILANEVMLRISRFGVTLFDETNEDADETAPYWFYQDHETMLRVIRDILSKAQEIFAAESRVVKVSSPCFVFGDLHGNLKDLLIFAHYFWRCAPFFTGSKCLFLGDYVDRGDFGIEVIVLLLCLKILAPTNFILLRGNHESRDMQEQFTFLLECQTRLSVEMWQLINDCFDQMPIAAVIDDRFFCAHGGIPVSVKSISALFSIPSPMPDPQKSAEAWQVMWNDPMDNAYFTFLAMEECNLMNSRGFISNIRRGTGYFYGDKLVTAFCAHNSIDFIIRGHEVFPTGIRFFCRGQVMSVFSCSNYVGLNNSAATLLVERNKIRVIRIEKEEPETRNRS